MDILTIIVTIVLLIIIAFIWFAIRDYLWRKHTNAAVDSLKKGDFDDALSEFVTAQGLGKDLNTSTSLTSMGNLAAGYEVKGMKKEAGSAYNSAAVMAYEMGKYEDALRLIEKSLNFIQDDKIIHQNRGVFLSTLKRPDEALEAYDRAIRWGSKDAVYKKIEILFELGRKTEAQEIIRDFFIKNPNDEKIKLLMQKNFSAFSIYENMTPEQMKKMYEEGKVNLQQYQEYLTKTKIN